MLKNAAIVMSLPFQTYMYPMGLLFLCQIMMSVLHLDAMYIVKSVASTVMLLYTCMNIIIMKVITLTKSILFHFFIRLFLFFFIPLLQFLYFIMLLCIMHVMTLCIMPIFVVFYIQCSSYMTFTVHGLDSQHQE